MSIEFSERREDNFTGPGNKVTLRWLESCVESARCRREERLIALLEIVRAEVIFEIELAALETSISRNPKTRTS